MACCEVVYCDDCYLDGAKKATNQLRVHIYSKCVHCTCEVLHHFNLAWLLVQISSYILCFLFQKQVVKINCVDQLCHFPGSQLTTSHSRGWGSIPGQSVWDLWLTKWHWGRFSSSSSVFPCQCSTNAPYSYFIHLELIVYVIIESIVK